MNHPTLAIRRSLAVLLAVGSVAAILPFAAPGQAEGKEVRWTTDYNAARELSKKSGKPVFMEFYADWCGPCKQMERTTFKDAQVVKMMDKFIPLRINVDKQPKLANKYEANSIPRAVVLAPSGKIVRISAGYRDAGSFILFLKQSL